MGHFPETGVALRAPALLGTRWIMNLVPFTLWWPLLPLRLLGNFGEQWDMKKIGMDKILQKPMHVEYLASAASNYLERPQVRFKGIVEDHWDIRRLGQSFTDSYTVEQPFHFVR